MNKMFFAFFILLSTLSASAQKAKDTIAIKKVLAADAAAWRANDIKAHAAGWAIQPYSRILVSTADGKCYDVSPKDVVKPPNGRLGNGGYAIMSNFTFSIQKKHAWVSHDEISVAIDGSKTYSHEIRMLEKIKGEWKLVGQSIHIYKPG